MIDLRHSFFAATLALLLSTTALLHAETRVALILTEPTATNDSLLALAEAKASSLSGIALVERREIDRVLREQKLTAAGLVEASHAVQAGKLLRADIVGVLEMDAHTKDATGIIVFDAHTGAQLWNAALPKEIEKAANAIVSGVEQAVAKAGLKAHSRRFVSLLTIRNADMPRSMDRFCDAVGVLFERDLMRNPAIGVLERRRLDQLNRERELAAAPFTNSLLASITLVSIDVNRGGKDNGVEAVVILRDLDGWTRERLTVAIPTEDAARLAEAMAARVNQALGVESTEAKRDAVLQRLEAQRFHREAQARASHDEVEAASRSAEAAHALDPNDLLIEALLMECLLDEGAKLLGDDSSQGFHVLNPRTGRLEPRTQAQILQALDFGCRSLSFWKRRLREATIAEDATRIYEQELQTRDASRAMVRYAQRIYWYCGDSVDPDVRQDYEQFRKQYLELDWTRFEVLARLAKENPNVFPQFTEALTAAITLFPGPTFRYFVPEPDEFVMRLDAYLRLWLRAANARPPSNDSGYKVRCLFDFLETFLLDPGRSLELTSPLREGRIQPRHLEKLKPVADAIMASPSRVVSAEGKMLRSHLDEWTARENKPESLEQTLARQRKALPERPLEGTNWAPVPWETPIRILSADKFPQIEGFGHFVVTEDSVYAFGIQRSGSNDLANPTGYKINMPLIRMPLVRGKPAVVNEISLYKDYGSQPIIIRQAQAVGTTIYALIRRDWPHLIHLANDTSCGIYELPTDGRPVTRIDDKLDLPNRNLQSFAVLDNKLYLGASGFIYSCDLTSKRIEVLASSRRSDKQSELEGAEYFETPFMTSDPSRNRVIVVTRPVHRTTNGRDFSAEVWSLDCASSKFTNLVNLKQGLQAQRMERAGEDAIVFSSINGLFTLDLARDELHRHGGAVPSSKDLAGPFYLYFDRGETWYEGPHLIHQGCFWSAGAFGRVNLENKQREYFQPIIPTHWKAGVEDEFIPGQGLLRFRGERPRVSSEITSGCLTTVENGTKLVFGTSFEVWLLPLRDAK